MFDWISAPKTRFSLQFLWQAGNVYCSPRAAMLNVWVFSGFQLTCSALSFIYFRYFIRKRNLSNELLSTFKQIFLIDLNVAECRDVF